MMEHLERIFRPPCLPGMDGQFLEFSIHGHLIPRIGEIKRRLEIREAGWAETLLLYRAADNCKRLGRSMPKDRG